MCKLDFSMLESFIIKNNLKDFITNDLIDTIIKNNEELNKILTQIFSSYKNKKIPLQVLNFNNFLCERIVMRFIDIYKYDVEIDVENKFLELEEKNLNDEIKLTDSYHDYIRSISKYPILNRKEEEYLFKEYNLAKSKNDISRVNYLKNIIIKCNLGLVVTIAKSFKNPEYPIMDKIQEGNISLFLAIDTFDITKGIKFSSYLQTNVTNHLINVLSRRFDINIKKHYYNAYKKINAVNNKYLVEHNRMATIDELVKETNLPISTIQNTLKYNYIVDSYDEKVNNNSEETEDSYIDFIESDINTEDIALNTFVRDDINQAYAKLTTTQQKILNARYFRNEKGFGETQDEFENENFDMKLEKEHLLTPYKRIGEKLNTSHQFIMQEEEKAIKKLRNSPKLKKDYYS